MTTLIKISKVNLPSLVAIAYKDDQELFDKYHIGKVNFEMAVVKTLQMIHEASKEVKLNYYKIIYQKEPIGYVVSFNNILYSFGVSIKYRRKDILIDWWQQIKKLMPQEFSCMLYANNTRAIEFIEKQGLKIVNFDEQSNMVVLSTQKQVVCQ